MKLIALVIEKYNDLFENQVLNFSDEYKVNFDFKTKELEIKKNQSYIDDFYDKGIYNITPIVGINGTGKSTILNIIYDVAATEKTKSKKIISLQKLHDDTTLKIDSSYFSDSNSYFLVYEKDDCLYFRTSNNLVDPSPLSENVIRNKMNNELNLISMLSDKDTFREGTVSFKSISAVYKRFKREQGMITSPLRIILEISFDNPHIPVASRRKQEGKTKMYEFTSTFPSYAFQNKTDETIEDYIELLGKKILHEIIWQLSVDRNPYPESREEVWDIYNPIVECYENLKNKIKRTGDLIENIYENISENLNNIEGSKVRRKETIALIKSYRNIFNYIADNKDTLGIEPSIVNNKLNFIISDNDSVLDFLEKFTDDFTNLLDTTYRIAIPKLKLSAGENNLLVLFAKTLDIFEQKDKRTTNIFLIDEIELGMHLEWSRQLINEYIKFIKKYSSQDKTIQLIFTTHSPYMLSDIKPGNVIMLEKDSSGQSKAKVLENTFAKNIQEIMKDNLIEKVYGDFALEKIEDLITKLQKDKSKQAKDSLTEDTDGIIKKQIQLISEPILRNKLSEMYDEKFKTDSSLLDKRLNKLNLTHEQREQVRKMIEENELSKDEKE